MDLDSRMSFFTERSGKNEDLIRRHESSYVMKTKIHNNERRPEESDAKNDPGDEFIGRDAGRRKPYVRSQNRKMPVLQGSVM